ncbi:hypothetical protein CP10743SC13_0436 [Chlamydia psittaci 10_743_SC13]|nr:hypothetical protein CP10743SC13_0436 [Chlamydia psittaci 10_743_SC13]
MCFPLPSCSCHYQQAQKEDRDPSSGSTPVVTSQLQLRSQNISFNIQRGDESVLEAMQKAGQLLSSFIDNQHTQQGARYCRDSCSPWCESHCPSWLSHCFQCLCACVINDNEGQMPHPDTAFLKELQERYGPVVAGVGIQTSGLDCGGVLLGRNLTNQERDHLEQCCKTAQTQIQEFFSKHLQKELFEIGDSQGSLPKIGGEETKAVRMGFHSVQKQTPTHVWITTGHSAIAPALMQPVNWKKLKCQLKGILCRNAITGRNQYVGKDASSITNILKNAFYFLLLGSPCFQHQVGEGNYGLTVTKSTFLKFLLCSLLALRLVPVDEKGNPPEDTWQLLMQIINFINTKPSLRSRTTSITFTNEDGDGIDGPRIRKGSSSPKGSTSGGVIPKIIIKSTVGGGTGDAAGAILRGATGGAVGSATDGTTGGATEGATGGATEGATGRVSQAEESDDEEEEWFDPNSQRVLVKQAGKANTIALGFI